ncbi:MAG: helix-turn-helix domain-containing protein [Acidobacteria bacterium]|nr:helix-turn-helix domain-containing protein [Acidobacteriota bacterium]MBI3422917.1 helix-turn-helix domain-containing protein [Acidobacteriota bacterium]
MPPPCKPEATPTDLITVYCALPPRQRQQRFFSTADIATQYGIAQRTVQDWISNGLIAAVKVGKKYHVDAPSVAAYLQRCAQQRE